MTSTEHTILDYVGKPSNSDGQLTVSYCEHQAAIAGRTTPHGRAIAGLLLEWTRYAKAHETEFESPIGDDGVLGRYWAEVGFAIKRLLDGPLGGFDAGSLATNITTTIKSQGFMTDGYSLLD